MIWDRTQNDVDVALRVIKEKIRLDPITMQPSNSESITTEETEALKKGTLNVEDLNRIENKQIELKNIFNDMGYWNTPKTNKTWDEAQVFDANEFKRIVDNTDMLRKAFFVFGDTPNTPTATYHYININAIEKILYDLGNMVDDVRSKYRECNTFFCGEE